MDLGSTSEVRELFPSKSGQALEDVSDNNPCDRYSAASAKSTTNECNSQVPLG